ncbi:MAG: hypothetical protein GF317_20300 [Candidatus Lokiarchaeota archaeon]|nr:hypothetical protein [Candidatus Lokiarchaeota archaeon]MBD3201829.1 hypothetical protein [Candidatus Lokiarchaeota archaeon]
MEGCRDQSSQGKRSAYSKELVKKKRPHEIKKLKGKLSRKTDQLLHQLANEIVDYTT